jgi:hypothetical protein
MWNPRQGEHSFIFRYTAEELCSVTTEYDTSNEAAKLCPTLGSREATPSSDKEAPSDIVTHNTKEGAKGRKKRHKQHPQGATTITDYDDGNVKKTGGSDVGCSHLHTTSRDCLRRPAQTRSTPSGTNSRTMT